MLWMETTTLHNVYAGTELDMSLQSPFSVSFQASRQAHMFQVDCDISVREKLMESFLVQFWFEDQEWWLNVDIGSWT